MSYPGVVCSRVSSIRVWRTLESMVTAVAMESRVQKLPRVRGGSYTGEAVEVFINTVSEKYLYTSPEPEKPEKYLYIHTFYNTFPGPKKYLYAPCWRSIYTLLRSRRSISSG